MDLCISYLLTCKCVKWRAHCRIPLTAELSNQQHVIVPGYVPRYILFINIHLSVINIGK